MCSVPRRIALVALLVLIILFLSGITSFGLMGPDEPRYASIGRAMQMSGDWITPRLWGHGWFEKPPLLYWLIAASFSLGLGPEAAPRLPVALASLAFLAFYFLYLRQEFNVFVGAVATGLLGTSALWLGYSHAAVTDIPLSITFAAACLLLMPAVEGRAVPVSMAAALLALSVLAKGLVPLVFILPFLWFARRHWHKWLRPSPVLVFCAIALPWYALCQARNPEFFHVFFVQHQLGRFTSPDLQHVQPFWFYVPVITVALFPGTLLCAFACWPRLYQDRRRRFLGATVLFGFLFLSISRNKLPGYILPLMPLVCLLAACGMDAARVLCKRRLTVVLAASALLLPVLVAAAGVLPQAFNGGLREALPPDPATVHRLWIAVPICLVAAACLWFLNSVLFDRARAVLFWFALAAAGWGYVEYAALPWVDAASARSVWRNLPEQKKTFCVGPVSRNWRYGLNYYSVTPLPDCAGNEIPAIMPGRSPSDRPVIISGKKQDKT
jgi:4-amino-4-deoxy-L-arabinose transferase-like glycosyltransferase